MKVRGVASRFRRWRSTRRLRRELRAQRAEKYWRRRDRARSRRFNTVKLRFGIRSIVGDAGDQLRISRHGVTKLLPTLILGGLCLVAILAVEYSLDRILEVDLIPRGESTRDFGAFPRIAVPVLAALLGFYLATVGIVLGNVYGNVAAALRYLILENTRTKFYLKSLTASIGAGAAILILLSLEFHSFGYLTIGIYVLLVCFGSWAFVQLAFGAFDLMNPVLLIDDPLRVLYRMVDRIGSRGVLLDEAVLRGSAQNANRSLDLIAELINVTTDRNSVDRNQLAEKVELLLTVVRDYARRKHQLAPDSGWFLPQTSYPRWVEANEQDISMALRTSTPLHPQNEPTTDWLETRTAELVTAALQACAKTDDVEAGLKIMRSAAWTGRFMARCHRIDDATTFAGVIRDCCHNMTSETDTANAVAPELPFMLTEIFLGWQAAIIAWPDEIKRVVDDTKWDRSTREVQIRGSRRIWDFAQRLLAEIHAEIDVVGRRITPDWYLRSALASESIVTIREFATKMPELLSSHLVPLNSSQMTPEARAATGSQALQSLEKAELLSEATSSALERLTELNRVHDVQPVHEVEQIALSIDHTRRSVLTQIAESVAQLTPVQTKSAPDYFGEALFTLTHHAESAIAEGDTELVAILFPTISQATLKLQDHVFVTYRPPTYNQSPADFNPILNLLDISGLALTYEAIRNDNSAESVRQSWHRLVGSTEGQGNLASQILDILDLAKSGWPHISWLSSEWDRRLVQRIVDEGLARQDRYPFDENPEWNAPLLVKVLGVSETFPRLAVDLHIMFAGHMLGPMTGESDEQLRARRGLKRFHEELDRLTAQGIGFQTDRGSAE